MPLLNTQIESQAQSLYEKFNMKFFRYATSDLEVMHQMFEITNADVIFVRC